MENNDEPTYSMRRYLFLFAAMLSIEAVVMAVTRGVNAPILTVFLPYAIGGSGAPFLLAVALSFLAEKKNRFTVCVWLAGILMLFGYFGRFSE